jgi:hypothetical protein
MKYVRLINNKVVEVINFNPTNVFNAAISWVVCPNDEVKPHWTTDGTNWFPPEVTTPTSSVSEQEAEALILTTALLGQVEQQRQKQCEVLPYPLYDGQFVQIKVKEEPPHKPRFSWIMGAGAWGQMKVAQGNPEETKTLIAADDTVHTISAEEWCSIGEALSTWIDTNLQVALSHVSVISQLQQAVNLSGLKDYNVMIGWPTQEV